MWARLSRSARLPCGAGGALLGGVRRLDHGGPAVGADLLGELLRDHRVRVGSVPQCVDAAPAGPDSPGEYGQADE
ncbi:hypothetical protein CNX65_25030 [Actinosynnema pretiosum]|uniref:Uncharacterized protein n=1 Tax=Actinosynnema pretiosum TaxID=42197 RepID=A0A290ZAW7_9PSEU|nr:hypothetical protein CNX65_25030 [Actinosynnema pretiosum]